MSSKNCVRPQTSRHSCSRIQVGSEGARRHPSLFVLLEVPTMATMTSRRHAWLVAALLTTAFCSREVHSFTSSFQRRWPSSVRTCRLFVSSEQQQRQSQQPSATEQPSEASTVAPLIRTKRAVKGVSSKSGPLNEEVARIADISLEDANELIKIGAIWARMDTLSEEDLLAQYDEGSASSASLLYSDYGSPENESIEDYVERMESQRYRRILTPSSVEAGTDIRVYPQPRRFPSCYDITQDSLLYEDTTFLVVDKPPMLPTQPDASNYFECCPACVNDLLGPFTTIAGDAVARPLICHRVDSCVGGCVVLSKDANGQKVFSELQRDRKLRKIYLSITTSPVPLGMHIHWMWSPQNVRGQTGGPPCQLLSHKPPESRRKARVRGKHVGCVDCFGALLLLTNSYFVSCLRSNFGHDVLWKWSSVNPSRLTPRMRMAMILVTNSTIRQRFVW